MLARRSWIAGALCVLVCASLTARAAGHVIEAQYLADPAAASPLRAARSTPPPAALPGRDASVLVDRNPFCSDCTRTGAGDPPPAGEPPPVTLPLALVATHVARDPAASFATLRHLERHGVGAYRAGDRVPGAGVVEKVAGTYVAIRTDAGALARVELLAAPPEPAAAAPPRAAAARPGADAPSWADRVRAIDDRTFEVERSLVRELVGTQARLPGVRVNPAVKNGRLAGLRIAAARPDSLAGALGLRAGDVIEAIDGHTLDDAQVALRAYGQLETASRVQITVARAGKPVQLEYRLR